MYLRNLEKSSIPNEESAKIMRFTPFNSTDRQLMNIKNAYLYVLHPQPPFYSSIFKKNISALLNKNTSSEQECRYEITYLSFFLSNKLVLV